MVSEKEIEDLIYEYPWILSPSLRPANVKGTRGKGRGIIISGKELDILFEDTQDNRPTIIEIKRGKLTREHMGQILEYRGLFSMFLENEDIRTIFGERLAFPKLILVGEGIDEDTRRACMLMNIEVRTFGGKSKDILDNVREIARHLEGDLRTDVNRVFILKELDKDIQTEFKNRFYVVCYPKVIGFLDYKFIYYEKRYQDFGEWHLTEQHQYIQLFDFSDWAYLHSKRINRFPKFRTLKTDYPALFDGETEINQDLICRKIPKRNLITESREKRLKTLHNLREFMLKVAAHLLS